MPSILTISDWSGVRNCIPRHLVYEYAECNLDVNIFILINAIVAHVLFSLPLLPRMIWVFDPGKTYLKEKILLRGSTQEAVYRLPLQIYSIAIGNDGHNVFTVLYFYLMKPNAYKITCCTLQDLSTTIVLKFDWSSVRRTHTLYFPRVNRRRRYCLSTSPPNVQNAQIHHFLLANMLPGSSDPRRSSQTPPYQTGLPKA